MVLLTAGHCRSPGKRFFRLLVDGGGYLTGNQLTMGATDGGGA